MTFSRGLHYLSGDKLKVGDKFHETLRGYLIIVGILDNGSLLVASEIANNFIVYIDKEEFTNNYYSQLLDTYLVNYIGRDLECVQKHLKILKKQNLNLYRQIILTEIIK
jgi:hypothetical protein